ncbi:MAG: hypothetical protein IJJ33_09465, partial [Victivallales bacterium]|nr:hypothetical protein [Victivallales bacterium]
CGAGASPRDCGDEPGAFCCVARAQARATVEMSQGLSVVWRGRKPVRQRSEEKWLANLQRGKTGV